MLETNMYVRCLLVDFSKAFDVVNHEILLDKFTALEYLPLFSIGLSRCGFAKQINDIVTSVDNASKDLFGKTMAPHHCLHSLLPLQIIVPAPAGTIILSPSANIICIGVLF